MNYSGSEIAVIGMELNVPGSKSVNEFWKNLCNGVEGIEEISKQELLERGIAYEKIEDPNYVRRKAVCKDYDYFDAAFFGYSQRESEIMDPQQRMFLECCWKAIENAGYIPNKMKGRTGVFGSAGFNTYLLNLVKDYPELLNEENFYTSFIGNDKDYLSTRVSHKLGLTGPSITVQSACSSVLSGIHLACQSLLTYESDCCVTGGVNIEFTADIGYKYQKGFIRSKDGHCRSYDNESSGTIFGSGVGAVVLKRLEDAISDNDEIYAIVRSTAVNNDGNRKIGFTAPSKEGQIEVIKDALEKEEIPPESIVYVEGHGTGTELGDPIEIQSIKEAIGLNEKEKQSKYPCGIGSVKSNIGHLDVAAGVVGFIKTCLCIYHKKIVPTLYFSTLNENVNLTNTRFYITDKQEEIDREFPIRMMVDALGIGGTNACVILEEYRKEVSPINKDTYLIKLSAKTEPSLQSFENKVIEGLESAYMGRYSYTLNTARDDYNYRKTLIVKKNSNNRYEVCHNELDHENKGKRNMISELGSSSRVLQKYYEYCIGEINKKVVISENLEWFGMMIAWQMALNSIIENRDQGLDKIELFKDICNQKVTITENSIIDFIHMNLAEQNYTVDSFLNEISDAWLKGKAIKWDELYDEDEKVKIMAPTYMFDKKKYWYNSTKKMSLIWEEKQEEISEEFLSTIDDSNPHILLIGKNVIEIHAVIEKTLTTDDKAGNIDSIKLNEEDSQDFYTEFAKKLKLSKESIRLVFTDGMGECKDTNHYFYFIVKALNYARQLIDYNLEVVFLNNLDSSNENIILSGMIYGIVTSLPMEMNNIVLKQVIVETQDLNSIQHTLTKSIYSGFQYIKLIVKGESIYTIQYTRKVLPRSKIEFVDGGDYIITGGTGNVGMLIADEISKRAKANIYLISRHYTEEMLSGSEQYKDKVIYNQILKLRKRAGSVTIVTLNLEEEEGIEAFTHFINSHSANIRGIIHAAGKVGKEKDYFEGITLANIKEYTKVKVGIAERILKLNSRYNFDFCIFLSSTVSALGGMGDSIYSGCNCALNYLVEYSKDACGNCQTLAFDYLPRVFRDEFFHENDMKYRGLYNNMLSYEEFSEIFDCFIANGQKVSFVSKSDINSRFLLFHSTYNRDAINKKERNSPIEYSKESIKRNVSALWKEGLGESCQEDTNFFDAGGDSLLAVSLSNNLSELYNKNFSIKYIFEFPTIQLMATDIYNQLIESDEQEIQNYDSFDKRNEKIAVIGMSGIFPKANNVDELWSNIMEKRNCLSYFEIGKENVINAAYDGKRAKGINVRGIIENVDTFDYEFFNIPKYEAELMDPQQRKFLECAWLALEDAGCIGRTDVVIGVFASQGISTYLLNNLMKNNCFKNDYNNAILMNNSPDAIATRVSYSLNLTGVSKTVQSFCSSSLNAMDDAIMSVRNGVCDVALVGGSNIVVPQESPYVYSEGSIFSSDGTMHPFDKKANGTIFSNGVGAVVIANEKWVKQRKCHVYAEIVDSSINNDGMQKVSYLSTSVKGQSECIGNIYKKNNVDFEKLKYIELHGTATNIGDPLEFYSLNKALKGHMSKNEMCAIGSIKANLGHMDRAAGITSFIKTCMVLDKKCIPPQAMFEQANKEIDFADSPFYINTQPVYLNSTEEVYAEVGALGVGGTNIHILLKSNSIDRNMTREIPYSIFTFSTASCETITEYLEKMKLHIGLSNDYKEDIEATLMLFRKDFSCRKAFVVRDKDSLVNSIENYLSLNNSLYEPLKKINTILIDNKVTKEELVMFCKYLCKSSVCFEELYRYKVESLTKDEVTKDILEEYISDALTQVLGEQLVILSDNVEAVAVDQRTVLVSSFKYSNCKMVNINNESSVYELLAILWESGLEIDWFTYRKSSDFRGSHLPGYVFRRSRCWIGE